MENYGFVLITNEEARQLGLPNASGLFSELFAVMENELKQNPRRKPEYKNAMYMTNAEKSLSFMNKYFVFKKMTSVKAQEIEKQFLNKSDWDLKQDEELLDLNNQIDREIRNQPAFSGKIRKLKAKIVLNKYISPVEKNTNDENEEFLNIEKEQFEEETKEEERKEELLEETEIPYSNLEETPIVLKPKIVLSDKKTVLKKNK